MEGGGDDGDHDPAGLLACTGKRALDAITESKNAALPTGKKSQIYLKRCCLSIFETIRKGWHVPWTFAPINRRRATGDRERASTTAPCNTHAKLNRKNTALVSGAMKVGVVRLSTDNSLAAARRTVCWPSERCTIRDY